ncbi:hypothetical protein NC653_002621 [Populus alba x Populus x berolinensis]|uniref:Uncharacterized protein n=1 Tax=Populus alba x Populus x berolinensis TaxID=444605 RepID=A0AAD6RQH8_9ROSI|nr:hypothetical protein NC653_002621 [Populus alba x Populus x berolinensis]
MEGTDYHCILCLDSCIGMRRLVSESSPPKVGRQGILNPTVWEVSVLLSDVIVSHQARIMFEGELYGRDAMNVVACEGRERVERPETYKQWQARTVRAGFKTLPLDQKLMTKFRGKLKTYYHKDFLIDEDNDWMLQGWKGRIIYASSCWVPA